MKRIKLSVHDFVDLLLRKGDIDNRIFNTISMHEGTRLHAWYQAKQESNYQPEVYLSHQFTYEGFILDMDGRADGIIVHDPKNVTVDEIKTTNTDVEAFYNSQKEWHLGQALVYAYIYLTDYKLENIKVQLTYISQTDTTDVKQYLFIYTKEQLETYITSLLKRYCSYLKIVTSLRRERNESIAFLPFPYQTFRDGQKQMIDFAYETIATGQIGFCEAKTGIGKTISALYPYIKNLGDKDLDKIFYLTSKSSIKKVAEETLLLLNNKGGKIKAVILTAKGKICPNVEKGHCNPDECLFAKNYYDKINDVIMFALRKQDVYSQKDILDIALANNICPFEFQLDLTNYSDVVVGDYNYLFDPSARLIRYFDTYTAKPYLLLIDEAHNLPKRVMEMFSACLDRNMASNALKSIKKERTKIASSIKKDLADFLDWLDAQKEEDSPSSYQAISECEEVPDALIDFLNGFINHTKKFLKKVKHTEDSFMNFYYEATNMLNLPVKDDRYAYYFTFDNLTKKAFSFSLSNLDPRYLIKEAYNASQGGLLFSATFSPKEYFMDLSGGDKDSLSLDIPSPFKRTNCLVMVNPFISTKYNQREESVGKIIADITALTSQKKGNYFVFFPSYEYMMKFKPFFSSLKGISAYFQQKDMDDNSREEFLSRFQKKPVRTTIGFIVLGGVFSEGIDLPEDRLIGAILVSVGLPKMSFIDDKIASYYGKENRSLGYNYAYSYPGINRVVQGAGRVIRSENDKGVILYIDTRYSYRMYQDILKSLYGRYIVEGNSVKIAEYVKKFWERHDE